MSQNNLESIVPKKNTVQQVTKMTPSLLRVVINSRREICTDIMRKINIFFPKSLKSIKNYNL